MCLFERLKILNLISCLLDYILVYQDHVANRDEKHEDDFERRREKREFFHNQLEKIGLKLETAQQDSHVSNSRRKLVK